jgi:uncharacterized protein (TIGR00290 family)
VDADQGLIQLSWSGGKDSCMALAELLRDYPGRLDGLLTTITRDYDRISMHGVRRALLEAQAESLGLPLYEVVIPKGASNQDYEASLATILTESIKRGVTTMAFGDLFLEDIRAYREKLMARLGLKTLYPVWGRDTAALIRRFIADGYRTIVVCVDPAKLDQSFAGRVIDDNFLADLPPHVDPCGENGEFHTFAFDGPLFNKPIAFTVGERVLRDGFWFCDLVPEKR